MYGRNGVDQLGFVTLWAAIILDVVNLFVRNQVAYSILSAVAMVLTVWMVFRMFSKNLSKRRAENAAYMNKVVYPCGRPCPAAGTRSTSISPAPTAARCAGYPGARAASSSPAPSAARKFTARADSKKISIPARVPRAGIFCSAAYPIHSTRQASRSISSEAALFSA